jgi:hypothetical protein
VAHARNQAARTQQFNPNRLRCPADTGKPLSRNGLIAHGRRTQFRRDQDRSRAVFHASLHPKDPLVAPESRNAWPCAQCPAWKTPAASP